MNTQLAQAVVRIREMALRGELPPGSRLAEAPLAEMLGMSRTPVRQALPLLAQEGLLLQHETRGYMVRSFTGADIVAAIDVRSVLEGLAARYVCERGVSRAFLREMRNCLDDGDSIFAKRRVEESDEAAYSEMNVRFHSLIMSAADSPILTDALERNSRIPFAGPQALAFDKANLDQMYDLLHYAHRQHHAVVQAFELGQSGRVEDLMREHANTVKQSINVAGFSINQTEGPQSFARGGKAPAIPLL
jgi:GntR family transcriptional regulator of vanillate catabolism